MGASYIVSVTNHGTYIFNHWSDGNHNAARIVTATGSMSLSAEYASSRRR
jgi:hypothetical protein